MIRMLNTIAACGKKIIKAYRKVFTDGSGKLKNEFQTAYVLPLHFKMAEGDEAGNMAKNLVRLIREADNHLTTGFPGTPYLLFALSDNGYLDAAYELLLQETCPSWLYQVKAGATTIWERWDALRPDGTINTGDLKTLKTNLEEAWSALIIMPAERWVTGCTEELPELNQPAAVIRPSGLPRNPAAA